MKININLKMDKNTLVFLIVTFIILLLAVVSSTENKSLIGVYQNCTCPDNNLYRDYWKYYELETDFEPINVYHKSMFENCTEIPCGCHKWGCALMCMICPDTTNQSIKN